MVLALLFDIDGTLMDTLEPIVAATNAALAEVGQPPLRSEELRPLIGTPVEHQLSLLRGLEGPVVRTIGDSYYRHYRTIIQRGVHPYPGVPETFRALKGRSIGTVTTRRRETARLMLGLAGIRTHFQSITGGDEVPRPKPHPDLVVHAAKSLGVPPSRCVVVGDSPVDILAGRAAKARTVAAMYGYGEPEAIRKAGPHAEIATFPDLLKILVEMEVAAGDA